jgi:hypothetical protein
LQVVQPIDYESEKSDGRYKIACIGQPGIGRRWGRADFPKGFSQWWFLSHIDFKVPSEHTQEGKRYAAEIQLHHVYSVTAEVAGVENQVRPRQRRLSSNRLQNLSQYHTRILFQNYFIFT